MSWLDLIGIFVVNLFFKVFLIFLKIKLNEYLLVREVFYVCGEVCEGF